MGTHKLCWLILFVLSCISKLVNAEVYVQDSFDNYVPGAHPHEWTQQPDNWGADYANWSSWGQTWADARDNGVEITTDSSVKLGDTGNSVRFQDSDSRWSGMLTHDFGSQLTSVFVEYYMMTPKRQSDHEGPYVVLLGDAGADYTVGFRNNKIGVHGWTHGWQEDLIVDYKINTWYRVRRTLDLATNTGLFTVAEIDGFGTVVHEVVSQNYGPDNPSTYMDKIWILTSGTYHADGYIDEITIATEPACEPGGVASGIDIEFVTIGNPGNTGDTLLMIEHPLVTGSTGFGAVGYEYDISKYEITNAQWNAFTAAAGAPSGNTVEGVNPYDENAFFTGPQEPANNISWYEAAQFCNYLTTCDKSQGAYQFSGDNANPGDFISIDRGAAMSAYGTVYVIPREDEWYKAAYYGSDGSGYSLFANGTGVAPAAGVDTNFNNAIGQPWNVGTGTIEQNGTYDMMGNIWEWNETLVIDPWRGLRGGAHSYGTKYLPASYRSFYEPYGEYENVGFGFRVARISAEPVCWVEQEKLTASDGTSSDRFGNQVAIDGSYAIVGAHGRNSYTGAAFIYYHDGNNWIEQDKLTASDERSGLSFAGYVDINGDAAMCSANGSANGAVYVFHRDPINGWTEQAILTASDGVAGDVFGSTFAIDDDWAVFGAASYHNANPGAAYVFNYDGALWVETRKISVASSDSNLRFGQNVSLKGDWVFVGAGNDDDKGANAGAAYVYMLSDPCWVQKLTASDGVAGDGFGYRVAVDGKYAAVAAYFAGAAYVFEHNGSSWVEIARLVSPDGGGPGRELSNLSMGGDYIILGYEGDDEMGANAGAAYVYQRSAAAWNYVTKLTASDPVGNDRFGIGVDINNGNAIVGADLKNGWIGAAYVFDNVCNTPPVAACQDVTVSADSDCQGNVMAQDVDDGSYDLDGDPITLSLDPPGPYPLGETFVMLTVSDGAESAMCEATVTVVDTTPPTLDCPSDIVLECPADTSPENTGSTTATDNCDESPVVSYSDTVTAGCGNTETITRTWTATDESGNSSSCVQVISVVDTTAPTITYLNADYLLAAVSQTVTFSVDVLDDCDSSADVEWDFGDGTEPSSTPTHEYEQPGIYTATATATDDCGNAVSGGIIIVVYDPSAGFTTGGGWFIPDDASFIDGVAVTDTVSKANFGFIVKYKKGADDPDGKLEFQYQAGGIDLKSQNMDWLVVQSTTKVRFKGQATINGEGLYTFKVTAEDNGEPGTDDWFKIEIWLGVVDTENGPQTPKHKAQGFLGGGNIQIHQK